jgi:hypothetical protein
LIPDHLQYLPSMTGTPKRLPPYVGYASAGIGPPRTPMPSKIALTGIRKTASHAGFF